MKKTLLLSAFAYLSTADFLSYEGGNCAFVYDAKRGATYPLDTCMTDYDAEDGSYTSYNYVCTMSSDGTPDIERYTYSGMNCDGSAISSSGVLGSGNLAYSCGATVAGSTSTATTSNVDCYLEYKEWSTTTSGCADYETASYQTKYIIVGACVNGPTQFQYSRCDPSGTTVQYVRFNDDMCCDLSYSYTGREGAAWRDYDITIGCDEDTGLYTDATAWTCNIPADADDADVFTDNIDPTCTDDAQSWMVALSVLVSIIAAMAT